MNKLSMHVQLDLVSFMNDCDLANFAGVNKTANEVKKKFYIRIEKARCEAWKAILGSSPEKIWNGDASPEHLCLNERMVTFFYKGNFLSYDKSNQNHGGFYNAYIKINSPNKWRICVNRSFSDLYSVMDKERFVPLDNIRMPDRIFAVYESNQSGTLQFITTKGLIILYTLPKLVNEQDRIRLVRGEKKTVSCIPSEHITSKISLTKVCKVKDDFYFQWCVNKNKTVLSGMKDLTNPNRHVIFKDKVKDENIVIASDENFFYYQLCDKLFICKDLRVWKVINLKCQEGLEIFPSDYGLVTSCIERGVNFKINKLVISIWNHRSSNVITPISEIEVPVKEAVPGVVVKEDVIFIFGKQVEVYHISTKESFTYKNSGKILSSIVIVPGRIPTEIIGIGVEENSESAKDCYYLYQQTKKSK